MRVLERRSTWQSGRRKTVLMRAVSELKEADYSNEPELHGMYRRLLKGENSLRIFLKKNIKAVMQISSLDLTMQHQTEKIIEISRRVLTKAHRVDFWFRRFVYVRQGKQSA